MLMVWVTCAVEKVDGKARDEMVEGRLKEKIERFSNTTNFRNVQQVMQIARFGQSDPVKRCSSY